MHTPIILRDWSKISAAGLYTSSVAHWDLLFNKQLSLGGAPVLTRYDEAARVVDTYSFAQVWRDHPLPVRLQEVVRFTPEGIRFEVQTKCPKLFRETSEFFLYLDSCTLKQKLNQLDF